jgi:hypothetical protein
MKKSRIANRIAADSPPTTPATVPDELFFEVSPLSPFAVSNGDPFESKDGSAEDEEEVTEGSVVGFGALVVTTTALVWNTVSKVLESVLSGLCDELGVSFGLLPFEEAD